MLAPHIDTPPPRGGFGPPDDDADHEDAPLFSRLRRIRSHARQRRSKRWIGVLVAIVMIATAAGLRFVPASPWYYAPEDPTPQVAPMPFQSTEVTVAEFAATGFLSWAYQDLRTGEVVGSTNLAETTEAGSLLTAWFGADVLRRAAETGTEPPETQLDDIELMIRDEDLAATDRVIALLDSVEASVGRLRTMCHLDDLTPVEGSWPATPISAQDAARLGGCLADGRAAGAQWTPWLLTQMRQPRTNDFGIRNAFPSDERAIIAVRNSVTPPDADGQWRANCLAVSDNWALAVLERYPASTDSNADIGKVEAVCQQVASQLMTP